MAAAAASLGWRSFECSMGSRRPQVTTFLVGGETTMVLAEKPRASAREGLPVGGQPLCLRSVAGATCRVSRGAAGDPVVKQGDPRSGEGVYYVEEEGFVQGIPFRYLPLADPVHEERYAVLWQSETAKAFKGPGGSADAMAVGENLRFLGDSTAAVALGASLREFGAANVTLYDCYPGQRYGVLFRAEAGLAYDLPDGNRVLTCSGENVVYFNTVPATSFLTSQLQKLGFVVSRGGGSGKIRVGTYKVYDTLQDPLD